MKEIPSNLFSWARNTGIADISVLNHYGFGIDGNKVKIKSTRTGKVLTFIMFKVDYADVNHEDVAGWHFAAAGLEDDKDIYLLIIND